MAAKIAKMKTLFLNCLKPSFFIVFIIIASTPLSLLLFGATICIGALVTWVFLVFLSLKPASLDTVNNVLGAPWGAWAKTQNLQNRNEPEVVKIIGHRACGIDAPENSMAALKKVTNAGITAVEFDVMLTADNVPVVFHDDSLERMTGDTRLVRDLTYKELCNFDISVKHSSWPAHENERIPTMEEYVEWCLKHNIKMLIDLKDENLVQHIVGIFQRCPQLAHQALVTSFNPWLIYRIRRADPRIVGCLAWRNYYYSHMECLGTLGPGRPYTGGWLCGFQSLLNIAHDWLLRNFLYHVLGLSAVLIHKNMISCSEIRFWMKRDIRVLAWTVNNPNEKLLCEEFWEIPYLTDTVKNEG